MDRPRNDIEIVDDRALVVGHGDVMDRHTIDLLAHLPRRDRRRPVPCRPVGGPTGPGWRNRKPA